MTDDVWEGRTGGGSEQLSERSTLRHSKFFVRRSDGLHATTDDNDDGCDDDGDDGYDDDNGYDEDDDDDDNDNGDEVDDN